MLPYPLNKIDAAVLDEICKQRFSESSTIDFKEELTKNSDQGKNEIAKDVCALANADGGDLVFGIKEERDGGTAESVVPLRGESFDEASRRILQALEAWVEPKIRGLQIQNIPVDGGFAMIVRVPASFDGPHCTRNNNGQRRFVVRNGTITADMNYDQLRTAFDRTASLADQARKFIAQRVLLAQERSMWRPMKDGPIAIIEFAPLSGLAGRASSDVKAVDYSTLMFWDGGCSHAMNLDGLVAYLGTDEGLWGMTQLYRNGCMETARVAGGTGNDGRTGVWSDVVVEFYIKAITSILASSKKFGISGPALMQCGVLHTMNCVLETGPNSTYSKSMIADRPHLVFPEIWIDDVAGDADAEQLLGVTKEVLWQSFGYLRPPAKR